MLWLKAFHIIFVICWFAGLFYLPRLFVYHASAEDQISRDRFKGMERKLYRGITTPSAVLAITFGLGLLYSQISAGMADYYAHATWLHIKLALVLLVIGYHISCGRLVKRFATDANVHGHVFYRWYNEFPVLLLIPIVLLVVIKPF